MSKKSVVPDFPCTQDNFYCFHYREAPHRVIYGVCQSPASNGKLCKECLANPQNNIAQSLCENTMEPQK